MDSQSPVQQHTEATAQQQTVVGQTNKQIVIVQGQLKKIIHQQGQGQCPKKGQQIYALYRGTLQNGSQFDSNQNRDDPFKFNLGQGRVIKGWDEGFASMKKGEKATLICSPDYAYGKRGSPPRIPPNSTLNFQVQLLDFKYKQKDKWQLNQQQKLTEATKSKNQGNQFFKKGDYNEATNLYKKGINFIEQQDSVQAQQILKVLRLNAAQSQIKIGAYSQAIKNCTTVLEKDSNNLKALYRRGLSHLKNQDFQKAEVDFQTLLNIQPTNTDAQKQLQNVKIAEKAFKQKQKKVYSNMFSKAGSLSQEPKKIQISKVEQKKEHVEQQVEQNEEEQVPQKSQSDKKED